MKQSDTIRLAAENPWTVVREVKARRGPIIATWMTTTLGLRRPDASRRYGCSLGSGRLAGAAEATVPAAQPAQA